MKAILILNIILLILCFVPRDLSAQDTTTTVSVDSLLQQDTLRIAIKESPPFTYKNEQGKYEGISIRLWEQIARELNVAYVFEEMPLNEIITAVGEERVDMAINPLTVTSERIETMNFTQPFYVSNSVVVTKQKETEGGFSFIERIFSLQFIEAVLLLFVTIFIFGFILWWVERKKNPQHFEAGWRGVLSGVWWSAATMTTVGYGDKVPRTTLGRFIGLIWMFTAIIIISGFMAGIASSLALENEEETWESVEDLHKYKIGSVKMSASESFLHNHLVQCVSYPDLDACLKGLEEDKVEAIVYDEPILRYTIVQKKLGQKFKILPFRFHTQYYSFATPKSSTLIPKINPLLLKITEDFRWNVILTTEYNLKKY